MRNPKNPLHRIRGLAGPMAVALAGSAALPSASAAVIASISDASSFPGTAAIRTFDPTTAGTDAERTLQQTATVNRVIAQTFQLATTVEIGQISLLYERGKSGTLVQVWVFAVANTGATSVQTDFNNALTNGFLLNAQFAMPTTPDEDKGVAGGVDRTLTITLTGDDVMTVAANIGTAGYAVAFQAVDADGTTSVLENAFTWRFRETSPYSSGRLYYDVFAGTQGSSTRDASLALVAVPEPAGIGLTGLGVLVLLGIRRRRV